MRKGNEMKGYGPAPFGKVPMVSSTWYAQNEVINDTNASDFANWVLSQMLF